MGKLFSMFTNSFEGCATKEVGQLIIHSGLSRQHVDDLKLMVISRYKEFKEKLMGKTSTVKSNKA